MLFYTNKMYLLENETNICAYNDTCDDYMKSLNLIFCAVATVNVNNNIYNVIIGDSNFERLDNKVQSFLFNHEVGHIKHNHLADLTERDSKRIILKRSLGILPKMEVEADCYAASVIGIANAKYSLLWMVKNKNLSLTSRLEALKRYLRVKEVPLA